MAQKYFKIIVIVVALIAWGLPAQAQSKKKPRKGKPNEVSRLKADIAKATEEHKADLEQMLLVYEPDVKKAAEEIEKKKQLHRLGLSSGADVAKSEKMLADAQTKVDEIRRRITEADHLIAEARAAEQIAMMPPARVGSYNATAALIRYNGPAGWALADVAKVDTFFRSRFARTLPVSAFGQTQTHDRMGFDHRNSVDVAVHPDSAEGQALLAYLRGAGIPFIAFRAAVSGSATGAHIHIGYPSRRFIR